MSRNYTKRLPSVTDGDMAGAYSDRPSATPKYRPDEGRSGRVQGLTVARLYITGDRDFDLLPGPAKNFSIGSFIGFFLQEVTERNSEKSQISPLNGDGYAAYFSGKEPSVYSFSGILLNTRQDQWRSTFTYLYDNLLRGSKITGLSRMVQVAYDDKVVTGSMMNLNQVLSTSPDETSTRFTFDLLVASVYDTWMKDERQFDETWSAFLGDTTIFPNVPMAPKKSSLKSYTNTAFCALPPKTRKGGGGKKKVSCDAGVVTRGLSGEAVAGNKPGIPESCYTSETLSSIKNEISVVDKKIAEAKDDQKKKTLQEERARLIRSSNTISTGIATRNKAIEEASKAAESQISQIQEEQTTSSEATTGPGSFVDDNASLP
jgi:hypothetical protein